MSRKPGVSVRLKLTFSYAGFLMLAGALLLATVWVFLLRYVPDHSISLRPGVGGLERFFPDRSDLQRAFVPRAAEAMGLLLVLGLVGGWLLAGRMLAPLGRITAATRKVASGSLSHRIAMGGRNDEFHELADSFDAMLARIEAHDAEQQRFAANASHELRTPLAITQTLLEVARNDPDRDIGALIGRLHTVNTRAIELTEALLTLSRADQRSFAREAVDLSLLAEDAVEALAPLADRRGVSVEVSGDPALASGSHALLLQLMTNLVHNAIVHNVAEGGAVWVSTGIDASGAQFTVENEGPLLAPELVATLTEPFRRGTERIHSDQAGLGLGLAIAKSIVHAHDGTLTLAARAGGGLRATVLLPHPASVAGSRRKR